MKDGVLTLKLIDASKDHATFNVVPTHGASVLTLQVGETIHLVASVPPVNVTMEWKREDPRSERNE